MYIVWKYPHKVQGVGKGSDEGESNQTCKLATDGHKEVII